MFTIIVEARRVLIKTRVLPAGTQVIISVMREISEYSLNITTVGRDCVAKSSVDMVVVGAVQWVMRWLLRTLPGPNLVNSAAVKVQLPEFDRSRGQANLTWYQSGKLASWTHTGISVWVQDISLKCSRTVKMQSQINHVTKQWPTAGDFCETKE